jgi:uncharacterized protein YjbI with pentapeptide repeats
MGYKSIKSIVKKNINKPNQPNSLTRRHKCCFCNICKGNPVDPRTRKAHRLKNAVTRNLGESSSKPTGSTELDFSEADLPELDFSEADLPELDFSDVDLPEPSIEESMQIDLSNNDSVISNNDIEYSFITKEKAKKGKKPIGSGEGG